jgi:hypothetical protein
MSAGKTSLAIQMMNDNPDKNFIYITPFLKEVERIKSSCTSKRFYDPHNVGNGTLDSLHNLLRDSKNIASTHALFQMSTDVTRELIKANNYTLILDEVCDVIEQIPLKKNDIEAILEYSHIDDGMLIWDDLKYEGRYGDIKAMALNKTIMVMNDILMMWNFPIEVFAAFEDCFIMTYMFDCQIQKYYYDMHKVNYEYYTVQKEEERYKLIPFSERKPYDKSKLKSKIQIYEGSLNKIGDDNYALSASWYSKDKNKPLVSIMKNNLYNYFRHKLNAKSNKILWTSFKNHRAKLSGSGFRRSFLACNARATNEYKERDCLAYCLNVFLNPIVEQFFHSKGVKVFEDGFALSELLQWIWRSAIREQNQINLYIPSSRMRGLLYAYLNDENI